MQAVRSIGADRLKRFVCLLLIFMLLFCFFMVPRASAVALEAATVAYAGALVGAILVGAGVVFASHGDMQAVGAAMYKSWVKSSNAIGTKIGALASWAVEHGEAAAKGALRVGKEMYQEIVDLYTASYSELSYDVTANNVNDFVKLFNTSQSIFLRVTAVNADYSQSAYVPWSLTYVVGDNGKDVYPVINDEQQAKSSIYSFYITKSDFLYMQMSYYSSNRYVEIFPHLRCDGTEMNGVSHYSLERIYYPFSVSYTPTFDLAYPSDDYLIKMPDLPAVDGVTGDVTYPSDAAYTKDAIAVPYPVDADGVKVPDIPYDQVVDQSTGKALDDTDTGTDTDNPSKPGEGTDTDTPSDTVNWPTSSDLSLPKLIISKFPFCIPFDIANMVGLLEAEPKAPVFKVPLKIGSTVDEEITLDLDQFSDVIRIIRWGELIIFVVGLALVTRNYIKW